MVTDDPEAARRGLEAGEAVVLIVPEGSEVKGMGGSGRLALLVGDPDDAEVGEAAREMERELFLFR